MRKIIIGGNYLENIFITCLTVLLLFSIQGLWFKIIEEDFSLSLKKYLLIASIISILSVAYMFIFSEFNIATICLSILAMFFTNLSIIDFKFFEISGKSYYFLIIPIIVYMFTNNMYPWWTCLISGILMLLFFMILDKIIGIEKIGGADVKLMLLGALMFTYYDLLLFVCFTFIFDIILFVILAIINAIKKGEKGIQIPMIVAISMSILALTIFCKHFIYI